MRSHLLLGNQHSWTCFEIFNLNQNGTPVKSLIAGTESGEIFIRCLDPADSREILIATHPDSLSVESIAVDEKNQRIYLAFGSAICFIDFRNDSPSSSNEDSLQSAGPWQDDISAMTLDKRCENLAVVDDSGATYIFELPRFESGELNRLRPLEWRKTHHLRPAHENIPMCVLSRSNHSGQWITGGLDGVLKLWDHRLGKCLFQLNVLEMAQIESSDESNSMKFVNPAWIYSADNEDDCFVFGLGDGSLLFLTRPLHQTGKTPLSKWSRFKTDQVHPYLVTSAKFLKASSQHRMYALVTASSNSLVTWAWNGNRQELMEKSRISFTEKINEMKLIDESESGFKLMILFADGTIHQTSLDNVQI